MSTPSLISSGSTTPKSMETPTLSVNVTVSCKVRTRIPTTLGDYYLHVYVNSKDNKEHLALTFNEYIVSKSLNVFESEDTEYLRKMRGATVTENVSTEDKPAQVNVDPAVPIRIHSECFTGETVNSIRCDCGEQLERAMKSMLTNRQGIILYLRQEGRGIGLLNKMRAYNIQDLGYDTVDANLKLGLPADGRDYEIAAAILEDLDVNTVSLMTNNPNKIKGLRRYGIEVVDRTPMVPKVWEEISQNNEEGKEADLKGFNEMDSYLRVKVDRMGHILNLPSI